MVDDQVFISFRIPAREYTLELSKIPRIIYQTWKTHYVSKTLHKNIRELLELNPEYEYYLYDDKDCQQFLLENFGNAYLQAFNNLKPGAFKADFWRYAMLYINGGVYLDIDLKYEKPLKYILHPDSPEELVLIRDLEVGDIYQAFIACVPGHPLIKAVLDQCFDNIYNQRMGNLISSLSVTGPRMMGEVYNRFYNKKNKELIVSHDPLVTILPMIATQNPLIFKNDLHANICEVVLNHKIPEYQQGNSYSKLYQEVDIYRDFKNRKRIRLQAMIRTYHEYLNDGNCFGGGRPKHMVRLTAMAMLLMFFALMLMVTHKVIFQNNYGQN